MNRHRVGVLLWLASIVFFFLAPTDTQPWQATVGVALIAAAFGVLMLGCWGRIFPSRSKPERTRRTPIPPPDVAADLMRTAESLTALYDFAEGQRAELERRGFSPTAAEMVVASWLANGGRS